MSDKADRRTHRAGVRGVCTFASGEPKTGNFGLAEVGSAGIYGLPLDLDTGAGPVRPAALSPDPPPPIRIR